MPTTKVCVTGGSGFIGSHICRELINQGHQVFCLDDFSGSDIGNIIDLCSHSQFRLIECDCRDTKKVEEIFKSHQPEVVYHLAANARESASFFQPQSVMSRNLHAYMNILVSGIKYGMKRMVLFSSIATYGHQQPPFSEVMKLQPVDVYGLAKATMESVSEMLSKTHNFEYVIFRPHNVFGEGQRLSDPFRNAIAIWMNRIMRGEPLIIYGDGEQQRAFSYISNSVPCYLAGMSCKSGQTFNIGSDKPWTINSMVVLVKEAMGVDSKYPVEHLKERHGEVKVAFSEHGKAKRDLGFRETVSTVEGIVRMANWAKEKGPQEWVEGDSLEIPNRLTPVNWR